MIDVLFEAPLKLFKHVIELMRSHEELEDSKLKGMHLMEGHGVSITIDNIQGGYMTQGCYRWLFEDGSLEGKLEAATFLRENDEKVRRGLKAMQEKWLKAHPKKK